jgi:putative transcriptional regulator
MEKSLFNELVESLNEMVAIEKGQIQPARVHRHSVKDLKDCQPDKEPGNRKK